MKMSLQFTFCHLDPFDNEIKFNIPGGLFAPRYSVQKHFLKIHFTLRK